MPRPRFNASRRLLYRAGVATVVIGVPMGLSVAAAPADGTSSYSGVASADGVRITTSAPGFLVVEDFVDAGGPTAQAAVSDVEGNRGYASVPYPGELAIAGPGLFAIATGQQFPGHYPFYVASAYPTTPKNEYDVPGLRMETQSDAGSSSARARLGASDDAPDGALSTAKVVHGADGGVTSEATGAADLLKVGPVEVFGFRSKASVSRAPGGEPQRSSSMEFSALKIADTAVAVRDGQFVVAGTTVPLDGFAPAQKALADAGVTVEMVQATKTDDGVVSPGIQITRKQPAAAAGTTMVVRYTLGRSLAAAKADQGSSPGGLDLGGAPAPDFGPSGAGSAPAAPGGSDAAPPPAPTAAAGDAGSAAGLDSGSGLGGRSSSASGAGFGFSAPGSGGADGAVPSLGSAGASAAGPGGDAAPGDAAQAASGSVDASLASAPVATGPIAPLSSWSFFPMMLLAGAAVAVVALGRKVLVRS